MDEKSSFILRMKQWVMTNYFLSFGRLKTWIFGNEQVSEMSEKIVEFSGKKIR